jgi:hypothetical protein
LEKKEASMLIARLRLKKHLEDDEIQHVGKTKGLIETLKAKYPKFAIALEPFLDVEEVILLGVLCLFFLFCYFVGSFNLTF